MSPVRSPPLSTASVPASPAPHVPPQLAGRPWWLLAAVAAVGTTVAAMESVQLGLSVALYVLVVGLHARSRTTGIAAMWLCWLVMPFIRRVFALHEGYTDTDPLAAVPFAVTATIGAVEFWSGRFSTRAKRIMAAAIAGYLIGVPFGLSQPSSLAFGLFAYSTAVLCFAIGYRESPTRPVLPRVLFVTLPVLAIYGLWQYFMTVPEWDTTWLRTVDFETAGAPEEGRPRVFSTLNSPGTFGMVLGVAVVTYLTARRFGPLRATGLVIVLTALALTYVRSAWVSLLFAFLAYLIITGGRSLPRIGLVLGIIVLGVPVLAADSGTGRALLERFSTLGSLERDESAQARLATPQELIPIAIASPLGIGLGRAGEAARLSEGLRNSDNAVLALMFQVGPFGTLLVLGALAAAARAAWYNARRSARRADLWIVVMVAFFLPAMFAGDVLFGITGMILWYVLGMGVARYEARQEGSPA
jgi:putative inorganic carbon (hco3(-)) transporter